MRLMAWHGQSVPLAELLFKTKHGLIDQSLHSRLGAETTNGDLRRLVRRRQGPRHLPQRPAGVG